MRKLETVQLPESADPNPARRQFVVNANYEIFILALTTLLLINSFVWWLLDDPDIIMVVVVVSVSICLALLVDSLFRIIRHRKPVVFLFKLQGWLLFVGSLPIPFISLLRFLWYGLMIRRFRHADYTDIGQLIVKKRAQSTLLLAVLTGILMLEFSGITILRAELVSSQANIHDANDALWWSFVTMATVGYGDKYPVTTSGRIIGIFVMSVGVGLFSVLTSYLAQWFFRPHEEKLAPSESPAPVIENAPEYVQILSQMEKLETILNQQEITHQEHMAELQKKLAKIEELLDDQTDSYTQA